MSPLLAHERVTADDSPPRRWLVVLHGIFGHGRNWATVARRLTQRRPDLGVILADLRQHGRSLGFSPPHNIDSATGDVAALVDHLQLGDHAILGHSFGGKVALCYAAARPAGLGCAFIVDSTPAVVAGKNQGAMMLALLRRLPQRFADREAAVQAMASFGVSIAVGRWMASNLVRDASPAANPDAAYVWRFDLDEIDTMLADFYPAEFWAMIESADPPCDLHFIRATEGTLISDEAAARIAATDTFGDRIHLHRAAGDHWLNVSNPEAIVDILDRHTPVDAS